MDVHLVPGERFGAYVIESELGRGGQAVVYRARQSGTERSVALKLFHEIDDDAKRARFAREAVAAARVEHPNIVPVYESGDVDGIPFLAMRLVPGPPLDEVLARFGALHPDRALAVLEDVAAAVDAAHEHNLVHRDIKPANVLLDLDDQAFLSDFGVARLDDMPRLTQRGDWLGTVEYMSPEQVEGHAVSASSDLYAFGVLCYEVLTGRPPFVHRHTSAVVVAHVRETPPPVTSIDPGLPPALDAVFATALAKSPSKRPASARELVRRIRTVFRDADLVRPEGVRSGDTRIAPVVPEHRDGWTSVMRRISENSGASPGPEAATRLASRHQLASRPHRPPPPPRGRGNRVRTTVLVMALALLVGAGSALGALYWKSQDDPDITAEREEAYHNGLRNGKNLGRKAGLADGRRQGEATGLAKGIEQGKAEGYQTGLAEGKKVPNGTPGDFRVIEVDQDGNARYLDGAFQVGSCVRITADGNAELLSPRFGSLFSACRGQDE